MSKHFESSVCGQFSGDLRALGYEAQGCLFVRRNEGLRGTVWLVEGVSSLKDRFMPRLSVGLDALGPDVAVLSRDLHQLVNPGAHTLWYSWAKGSESIDEAKRDLLTHGLPWLAKHRTLPGLTEALEQQQHSPGEVARQPWWHLGRQQARSSPPRANLNVLQALSLAYELQGRYDQAIDAWRSYIAGHSQLRKGTELERLLTERLESLNAARDKSTG